jgi:hypothetical protein
VRAYEEEALLQLQRSLGPGHRCMGKGEIHYIEVVVDSVDSEEEEQDSGSTSSEEESAPAEE